MKEAAKRFGPETVAFSVTTSSGTAISDAMPWIYRLINSFGSPNSVRTRMSAIGTRTTPPPSLSVLKAGCRTSNVQVA